MATTAIIILLLSLAVPSLISCSWPSDFLCGVWLLHFLWLTHTTVGTTGIADDMIVYAETEEEHD